MILGDEVGHFVEDDYSLMLISLEYLISFHPVQHISILILGLDILAVKGSSNTCFENEISIRIFFTGSTTIKKKKLIKRFFNFTYTLEFKHFSDIFILRNRVLTSSTMYAVSLRMLTSKLLSLHHFLSSINENKLDKI